MTRIAADEKTETEPGAALERRATFCAIRGKQILAERAKKQSRKTRRSIAAWNREVTLGPAGIFDDDKPEGEQKFDLNL
jgi:hypothetical protein